jgi:hypothetical protein
MEKLVRYDEVLESRRLARKVIGEGNGAGRRARTPFARHTLHANDPGLDI